MDSTLAVGLLVVGFVSAFAAIGGKTWRDDQTIPWSRRITARGWIAITCMSLTLGTGILKHVRDRAGIAEARQRAVQSEAKVAEQTRKISDQGTKLEQLAGELRSERQKREAAEKADDDVFAIARKNIEWAVKLGGRNSYLGARSAGKSPWEAVLLAQRHNPTVVELVKAYGPPRTEQFIRRIGE